MSLFDGTEEEEETVDVSQVPDLTAMMVEQRARGRTLSEISARTGVPVAEVQRRVREHLLDNYGADDVAMQRMLMLNRLERIIDALWEQVMEGDLATEGKQIKNLIDLLKMLSELLDLNKDRVRDELVQLTKAQTELVHTMLAAMRTELAARVMQAVQQVPATGGPEEVKATLRERIDGGFSGWYAEASQKALEQADSTVVTVGGERADQGTYGDEKIVE